MGLSVSGWRPPARRVGRHRCPEASPQFVPRAHPSRTHPCACISTERVSRSPSSKGRCRRPSSRVAFALLPRYVTPAPTRNISDPVRAARNLRKPGEGLRRSEEHTSELQSRLHLACRLLLDKFVL